MSTKPSENALLQQFGANGNAVMIPLAKRDPLAVQEK